MKRPYNKDENKDDKYIQMRKRKSGMIKDPIGELLNANFCHDGKSDYIDGETFYKILSNEDASKNVFKLDNKDNNDLDLYDRYQENGKYKESQQGSLSKLNETRLQSYMIERGQMRHDLLNNKSSHQSTNKNDICSRVISGIENHISLLELESMTKDLWVSIKELIYKKYAEEIDIATFTPEYNELDYILKRENDFNDPVYIDIISKKYYFSNASTNKYMDANGFYIHTFNIKKVDDYVINIFLLNNKDGMKSYVMICKCQKFTNDSCLNVKLSDFILICDTQK